MDITSLLTKSFIDRDGVLLPEGMQEKTVWDQLSQSDLLDAATSAESETHAVEKGKAQIAHLERTAVDGVFLDIGCGYGRIAEQLLPKRDFAAYIGVDSSVSMLRFAKERKHDRPTGSTPCHWVYGEIDSLPLKDNSVNTVIVSAVFLHNHKSVTKRSIAEITRVLQPGGVVIVYTSFPNVHCALGYQGALYNWYLTLVGDQYRNGPVRYFSRSEIRRLFAEYVEVSVTPLGFALLPKGLIFLPKSVDTWYRLHIANPVNHWLTIALPESWQRLLPTHWDVVAKR